ncbi:hypothetical protein C8Q73DRAFT_749182 [Cubamyces lactineus]|nr:hypothetical protein C8Q73DRAFT_749182 [Cubamyces lactineus]
MPKISRDRKVIAKEEPLGMYHCILLRPLKEYKLEEYKPVPSNLHFRKTKILYRIKEYEKLFEPTVERLTPFVKKALSDDRISEAMKARINTWGKEFNDLWVNFNAWADKLTNKEWRILKKQLKAIGRISFENLNQRLPEISKEIDALNLSFDYAEMAQHMDANFTNLMQHVSHLTAQVTTLTTLVQNQQALVTSYKQQVDALPASTGGGSRQPKIGEPPIFKGSDDKIKLEEWRNLISLWCAHEGITTDKQKIVTTLSRLQGPAHKYMASYYDRVGRGQDLGTWDAFMDELAQIYGQRDDKEGAKKEITALFSNKELAAKDFIKYAERFRTLGRLTGYDDELLIDKLREVVSRDMRIALVGTRGSDAPKKWPDFLDMLLDFYRELNPEKTRGTVFSKGGSDNSGHTPMDIDSAEKSKGKGKNSKQANIATTEKKNCFCHICKSKTHNTDDCFQLVKNADKRAKFQNQSKGADQKTGGNEAQSSKPGKVKKTQIIEVEVTDNEEEPPATSASISTARIEQEDGDEPQTRPSQPGKGKARALVSSDFLTRYM